MKKIQKNRMYQFYIELVKLQNYVISSDLKLLVILEGRDAAGKDGTVKKIIKHLSPRETRVVALAKPTDKENREWYFQRYSNHLPTGGEIVIFNRSWYNRVGVEKVMGFCNEKQYEQYFNDVELYEKLLVNAGVIVIKYYLDISKKEQSKRLEDRKINPLKQWKISLIDNKAQYLWDRYSEARNEMLLRTNYDFSPWYIVNAEKKDEAHIALISHLLNQINYKNKNKELLKSLSGLIYSATSDNIENKLYK